MANGGAVADADVAVIDGWHGAVLASGRSDASGLVQLPGSGELDPQLKRQYVSTRDSQHEPLVLRVTRGDDIALLPLASEFQIDTWRASREQIYEWRDRKSTTSELQSLMRISYAVFCLQQKKKKKE